MNSIFLPGIGTAFLILFSLLFFVAVTVITIIFIERVWTGQSRWLILPVVLFSVAAFGFHPSLFLSVFKAMFIHPFLGLFMVTGFGILAGMSATSL